jgi:hypothetical protein
MREVARPDRGVARASSIAMRICPILPKGSLLSAMPMAGYSGTPLAKKLGLKSPMTLVTISAPTEYVTWLGELPGDVVITSATKKKRGIQAAHLFAIKAADLRKHLARLRVALTPAGFVWVSWPKKASKVPTDITEDTIRDVALPMGFVDIKVCAVTEVWSGLKLVIRKSER